MEAARCRISDLVRNYQSCAFQKRPFRAHFSSDVVALAKPLANDVRRNRCPPHAASQLIVCILPITPPSKWGWSNGCEMDKTDNSAPEGGTERQAFAGTRLAPNVGTCVIKRKTHLWKQAACCTVVEQSVSSCICRLWFNEEAACGGCWCQPGEAFVHLPTRAQSCDETAAASALRG